jgi:serine protease Do
MPAFFNLTRNTARSLAVVALLSTTAVVSTLTFIPSPEVQAGTAQPLDPSLGFSQLVDQVMPSVVSVTVKIQQAAADETMTENGMPNLDQLPPQFRDFFEKMPQFRNQQPGPRHPSMAQGSGFVISADGYVVTNNHVVDKASEVSVQFNGGEEFTATVIGVDPKTDLALLKIKAEKSFPFVSLSADEAKVGDWVMAVGNPFGLGGTVTSGIISARGRDIGNGPYDDFLQIDASINHGNSGGPAFNLKGDVIGVNTAIYSPSGGSVGIGFAIPASTVKDVVDSLKANGSVTRGWLGVRIQPVTDELAEGLGMAKKQGAIVTEVTEGSPALAGGVKQGDTILKVDGTDIQDARDLSRKVAKVPPGKAVEIAIIRDGKPETVTVTLGKMPDDLSKVASAAPSKPAPGEMDALGLKVEPADDGAGVKVVEVAPNSPAAERGISVGDVILEVAGTEVNSPADVATALKADANKRVLILVKQGDNQRFVALPKKAG